jgi:hypothetical protein
MKRATIEYLPEGGEGIKPDYSPSENLLDSVSYPAIFQEPDSKLTNAG